MSPAAHTPARTLSTPHLSRAALLTTICTLSSLAAAQAANPPQVQTVPANNVAANEDPVNQATLNEVRAWFDKAWADAAQLPDLKDHKFTWKLTQTARYRNMINESQKFLTTSPREVPRFKEDITSQRVVLCRNNDAWRFNLTWDSTSLFHDTVYTSDSAWMVMAGSLQIFDPQSKDPDSPTQLLSHIPNGFRLDLSHHTSNGFAIGHMAKLTVSRFTVNEDNMWFCTASSKHNDEVTYAVTFQGRWHPELRRGRVEYLTVIKDKTLPHTEWNRTRYSGYCFDEATGLDIAQDVVHTDETGHHLFHSKVIGLEPLPQGGFKAATTPPTPTSFADPIRGDLTLQTIYNHRDMTITDIATGTRTPLILPSLTPTPAPKQPN